MLIAPKNSLWNLECSAIQSNLTDSFDQNIIVANRVKTCIMHISLEYSNLLAICLILLYYVYSNFNVSLVCVFDIDFICVMKQHEIKRECA